VIFAIGEEYGAVKIDVLLSKQHRIESRFNAVLFC